MALTLRRSYAILSFVTLGSASPAQIEAAARALHRFNAPRVGNGVEDWEHIGAGPQSRWMNQAALALAAAAVVRAEEQTPVVEVRGG